MNTARFRQAARYALLPPLMLAAALGMAVTLSTTAPVMGHIAPIIVMDHDAVGYIKPVIVMGEEVIPHIKPVIVMRDD